MKIAIATEDNRASEHFGYCQGFTVYELKENEILNSEFISNPGHRPGFLPMFLKEAGVDIIVSGGMGGSAQQLFINNGIDVIVGAEGSCDSIIESYIKGELKSTGQVCHDHSKE